ncbi:MAG: ABC transporter, permease protein 2 (cluster 1, maltose/g3p/polyamine/iron), partial [uncultured Thermomicrobiales bacterium]
GPTESTDRGPGGAATGGARGAGPPLRRESGLLRDHGRPGARVHRAAPLDGDCIAETGEPGAGEPAHIPPAPLPVGELRGRPRGDPAVRLQQLQARVPDRRRRAARHPARRLRLRPAQLLGARLRLLGPAGDADGPEHRDAHPALHHLQEHRLDRHALPPLGAEGAALGHRDLPAAAILQADPDGTGGCRAARRGLDLPGLLADHAAAGQTGAGGGGDLLVPRLLERPVRPADLPQQPGVADPTGGAEALPGGVLHPDQCPD